MSGQTATVEAYAHDFASRQAALPGSDIPWLAAQRAAALQSFVTQGFPDAADEDWRYCDLTALARQFFPPAPAPDVALYASAMEPCVAADALRLTFVDGHYAAALSTHTHIPGIELLPLRDALHRHPTTLQSHWGRHARAGLSAPAALNAAFWQDGAFITTRDDESNGVPPVELLFLWTTASHHSAHGRVLVRVGPRRQLTLVERHVSLGTGGAFNTCVSEIVLEPDAELCHLYLQGACDTAFQLSDAYVHIGRDSHYLRHQLTHGAARHRNALHAALADEGAQCTINGLMLAHARQHLAARIAIEHFAPRTISRILCKAIIADEAQHALRGCITVHPQARPADAQLTHHSLLLSPTAEADSQPQLEIHADDVKCSHGASIGRIDEDALFYLRCRGLDAGSARGLLLEAFATDITRRAPCGFFDEALRRWITSRPLR
jgi:Fe-S cluster assembly protein SufD